MPVAFPVIFTPRARAELIDAQHYENEVPGLGRRFRAAIDAVVERMNGNPRQFPIVYKGIDRAPLRRFPYALMFVIENAHRDRLFSRQPRSGALAGAGVNREQRNSVEYAQFRQWMVVIA